LRRYANAGDHRFSLEARAEVWDLYKAVDAAEQKFCDIVILAA
jgi:hypothetical protein